MTEIKHYLTGNEIEMLKDLMDPNSDCDIYNINLQWTDELISLLNSIGNLVTAPGFDKEYWQKMFNTNDTSIEDMDICQFLEFKNSPHRCPDCGMIHAKENT